MSRHSRGDMFINNRYTSIYNSIISNAKHELRAKRGQEYYESHHIIPKSLGGTNNSENLVLLTAREHFICHRLLTRMTTGKDLSRMMCAFSFMVFGQSPDHKGCRIPSSNHLAIAKVFSQHNRDQTWKDNISKARMGYKPSKQAVESMAKTLTGRKLSEEHKRNIGKGSKGFSRKAIDAHTLNHQKEFSIILPSGETIIILNLKKWCRDNDINYQSAYNNSKYENPIKCGKLKGYKFIRHES